MQLLQGDGKKDFFHTPFAVLSAIAGASSHRAVATFEDGLLEDMDSILSGKNVGRGHHDGNKHEYDRCRTHP